VNGEHLPNSAQLKADAEGHALPQYRLQAVLDDSEYLLLSDVNPQSFDARYFGLIARNQIKQVVRPVFTWGH
jgi:conjugative transfer signal peptidase TraF